MLGMLGHSDTNGGVMSAVTSTPVYVRALYDYSCNDASALRFRRNDIIEVITQLDSGWWDGRCNGERGWFPSNFVEQVEPGIPESVFVDDESGLDWKASGDDTSTYPVADESELSRGVIGANQSLHTPDGDNYTAQLSPNTMTSASAAASATASNYQIAAGRSATSQYVNSNGIASDSGNNAGEIVLAADDYEVAEQPSAVLRLSRVPPNAWIPQETDEGHIYYFNPTTRVTAWELPPGGHELTAEEATALAAMDADPQYQQFDSSAILDNYLSEVNEHGAVQHANQRVNSSEGQDGAGVMASRKPNERKASSGNRSTDSAMKRKQAPMEPEPEIPDDQLPPYWGKKRTPEGRVYYFNMITDETLWSLANVDMTTGKSLNVDATSNRSSMHSNTSDNSIEEAPYFTVNALARTPSVTTPTSVNAFTGIDNQNGNTGVLTNGEARAPLRKPSGFVGKLHAHHRPMDSVDANGYTHNGAGNPEVGITWSRLVALIVLAIHRLNHSAKRTTKSAYIADSLLIVDAISAMLMASGTMQRDSPAIKAHNLLKAHHAHLMSALSKLVLSAKDASRVWPPPDAVQQMQRDANEVLLASRYFMNVAQDVGIPVRPVDGIDVDALEVELSGPTVTGAITATTPTTANHSQITNSTNNTSYDTSYSNGTTIYDRSRSSISSANGNEALYADQPAASVDLLVRFSQHSHAILRMVSSMQRHLQHLRMDLHHLPNTNQAPASPQTITHAKQMVSVTEQFLQLVNDMEFEHISQESADRLMDARRTLQGEVICLMMAVQEATDSEADVTNIEACLERLRMVDNTAKELLIASKLQVEERDALRHRALEQNVDRFRAVQRNGDRLEATIRVRRALSMSHVVSDGDRIEALMMEQDQMGDLNQYNDEDIQSMLDRNGGNLTNYSDANHYMYGNSINDANGHGNGYTMSSGKKMSMAKARTMNRLHTEPSLHQGATAAAMRTAARYTRNGELSPSSETEGTMGRGNYFDSSNGTLRQDKYSFFDEADEDEEDMMGQDEHGEFSMDNYGNMLDRKDGNYEGMHHQQPDSYPIPDGLMSVVAPWTVQSPDHGTIPPAKASTNQALPPPSSASTTSFSNNIPNRMEMSRKAAQILGEDVPLTGNTAPILTSSKPAAEEKPWFLGYDYDEGEIVFTVDANVKGGTLRALVERCTLHDALDTTFVNNFLLTYRSFTTSEEFLNLLFKRFQVQPPPGLTSEEMEIWRSKKQKPIQLRVFNIIKQWLEFIYHDDDDSVLLTRLHEFIRTTMSPHLKTSSLLKLIEKRQTKTNDYSLRKLVRNIKQEAPPSIMPKNLKKLKFLDIDPTEFARQLTIMDSGLYNKITPVECLNKAWSNKENSCAVNIKAMIEISNHLTHWVIESILQEKIPQKRAHLIRHFVAIADRCMSLNNYNSLMAILAGLNSAPIHRLKRTWELIPTKTTVVLDMVKARMNQTKNFSTYREGLHSIDPPCVPFLGVYLTDLTFIDDGNPDKLPGTDLINFSKYSKCADVITEIQQYQKLPYCLTTVPQIKLFLERNLQGGRDVQDLYNMSLNMEPREREDEKIARLLHESGFL